MKVTRSRYAPVMETSRAKRRKKKEEKAPLSVNTRFPGGGFAARMKKLMETGKQGSGGRKMLLDTSTSSFRGKGAQRKKTVVDCMKKEIQHNFQLKKLKVQSGGPSSPEVKEEEDFVIGSFDNKELPATTAGGAKINSRKVEGIKETGRSEGEIGEANISGLLHPKAGSSNTVTEVYEEKRMLKVKAKGWKQGIPKKSGRRSSCGSCKACTRDPCGVCKFCTKPKLKNRFCLPGLYCDVLILWLQVQSSKVLSNAGEG